MAPIQLDRREFLKVTGAGVATGLTIGASTATLGCRNVAREAPDTSDWRAWVHIGADGRVVVACPRSEMGQGAQTTLAMAAAEGLDADWASVSVEPVPLDLAYGSLTTENSDSVRTHWMMLRRLGAAARAQIVRAAAQQWGVPPDECETAFGVVVHGASGRHAGYGELASAASRLPLVEEVR